MDNSTKTKNLKATDEDYRRNPMLHYERKSKRDFSPRVENHHGVKRRFSDITPRRERSPSVEEIDHHPKRLRIDTEVTHKSPISCIDTHCHLDIMFNRIGFVGSFSDYFKSSGLPLSFEGCIAIFCNPSTFKTVGQSKWSQLQHGKRMWAAFGCHPHNAKDFDDEAEQNLKIALTNPNVVALGEIGLDFSNRNGVDTEIQKRVFRLQIDIAIERKLPIVIHSRDATDDTLEIMKKHVPKNHKIHRHCFTGNWEEAEVWLNSFPNLCIGLTNVVSYPSAKGVHEVARKIPIDRLLLETDAPYFGRGKGDSSNPGMVVEVAIHIARLRNVKTEEVIRCTRENTRRIYSI